ncbi:MAG: ATP-binding cassette domain-containing protein [Cyclobacteriaceae bacterium]
MKIVAKGLGKRFNREWIFKKFDFTFSSDQTFAIVGPNGSGKSTLLQILWGQLPPSSGALQYDLDGNSIDIEDLYKYISIAAPYMEVIEEFTLLEMLQFHYKFKNTIQSKSIEEVMEMMELDHARNKVISNFSSGMKQRLKLGLAFFSDTSFLFLDEPTTNLDKKATTWYQEQLGLCTSKRLVIIASNQEHEYPETALKVDLSLLK